MTTFLWLFLSQLSRDVRYSFRMMTRNSGATVTAVLTLALGIGAGTAIFSIVNSVLLRPLPYPDSERIVQVREVNEKGNRIPVAGPNYTDIAAASRSFEALARFNTGETAVVGGLEPINTRVTATSADFFRVMKVNPALGRPFLPEESRPEGTPVAVVSHGFWQRMLGGRADLNGATLKVYDKNFAVVGVMPQGFAFPVRTDVWVPSEQLNIGGTRTAHNWNAVGRLRSDAPLKQAQTEMSGIAANLRKQYGAETDAVDFALIPLREYATANVRTGLFAALGAVGVLLLIACANTANVLLAQSIGRRKEIALRMALGAARWMLLKQSVTECALLVLPAGFLGMIVSFWGVAVLVWLNAGLPRTSEIRVDFRALIFALAVSLTISLILGLVTMLRVSNMDPESFLKEAGNQRTDGPGGTRLRGGLVSAQVALTLMLLICAGLLGRSFLTLLRIDPGFKPESVLAAYVSVEPTGDDKQSVARFHARALERIAALPGVKSVGGINALPMTGRGGNGLFAIDNDKTRTAQALFRVAAPGYFEAMGIPLLQGRIFEQGDQPDSTHVAVISQSLAKKVWPGVSPIGQRIQFGNMDGDLRLLHVVGVVGDVRDNGLDTDATETVYAYYLQRPNTARGFSFVVRTDGDPATVTAGIRREISGLNPEVPTRFQTVDEIVSASFDGRRFSFVVFAAFAGSALLLAIVGMYGVTAYTVSQRTREVGIRMALGARAADILKLIVGQGVKPVLVGLAIGAAAAFWVTRLMVDLLFDISPNDPATFAAVPLLLVVTALAACAIPALRAARTDPTTALRTE